MMNMNRICTLVCAVNLMLGGIASAHGNQQHIRGTIVSVSDTAITVKTTAGATRTLSIMSETKVLRGKTPAALKDVKAGDRVVVHAMKHDKELMASEIVLASPATSR